MKHFMIFLAAILLALPFEAHSQEPDIFRKVSGSSEIRHGDTIQYHIPVNVRYLFPEFTQAAVFNHNGSRYFGTVNVSLLDQRLKMIDSNGDTLDVYNQEAIDRVNTEHFRLVRASDKFVVIHTEYNDVTLSVYTELHIASDNKEEGSRHGSKISSISDSYLSGQFKNAPYVPKDRSKNVNTLQYFRESEYVLTVGTTMLPATESSFIRIFPRKKKAIKEFVNTYRVDFENPDSITTLLDLCTEDDR